MPTEREVKQRYNQARLDDKNGKYAEALEGYLYFLDNSTSAGVRLSYTLSDIMTLSSVLPAAREALEDRRNRYEARILEGTGDYSEIHDLTSFNKYLGEPERSAALLDRLAHAVPERQEFYTKLLDNLWEPLAEEGLYKKLDTIIDSKARSITGHLADLYIRWSFQTEGSFEQLRDISTVRYQLGKAVLAYEVLIALRKDTAAETLARWIMKCDPYGEAQPFLEEAEIKAKLVGDRE